MTIVDAMRDALEHASMNGIKPTSLSLGPAKWRQWREFVTAELAGTLHAKVGHKSETFGGIPVCQGSEPGIVVS